MHSLCVVDRYRFPLSLQCDSALRVWVAAGVHFKSGKPRVNILGWMLNGCLGRGEGSYYFERMWLWARFRVIVWGLGLNLMLPNRGCKNKIVWFLFAKLFLAIIIVI